MRGMVSVLMGKGKTNKSLYTPRTLQLQEIHYWKSPSFSNKEPIFYALMCIVVGVTPRYQPYVQVLALLNERYILSNVVVSHKKERTESSYFIWPSLSKYLKRYDSVSYENIQSCPVTSSPACLIMYRLSGRPMKSRKSSKQICFVV